MNDEFLNIRLTESDVNLIMNALDLFAASHDGDTGALELHDDLFEQVATIDVLNDIEPTEIEEGRTFSVAESDFIDHGIRAREMQKQTSRAAERRTMRFGEFTVDTRDRSEQQSVDVWDDTDPRNW
tara:strand:+ start:456 stop:833 length:378 start_codon:yes stop_codon:yes gene_type:complete